MDSGSSIHVVNRRDTLRHYKETTTEFALCGSGKVCIRGWGEWHIFLRQGNKKMRKSTSPLVLRRVAFCPDFPTSIVSLQCLEKLSISWLHTEGLIQLEGQIIGRTRKLHGQYVIDVEQQKHSQNPQVFSARQKRPNHISWADGSLWHRRFGHIGSKALQQVAINCLGARIRPPKLAECDDCALSKITQQNVNHGLSLSKSTIPFYRVFIDWHDLKEGWDGYQGDGRVVRRVMLITCEATNLVLAYFTYSNGEKENWGIINDVYQWLLLRYGLKIFVIRSDHELLRICTKFELQNRGVTLEPSAPHTHEQNGGAEVMGRIIMARARAMRLSAKLPHDLWREIVEAAVYLYNRTPQKSSESPEDPKRQWRSPYEMFSEFVMKEHKLNGPRQPIISHLRAYGCKSFILIKNPLQKKRLEKLAPKAHIGFLVGYQSTNIYRIWIPYRKQIISARDVIFDERTFFDGQRIQIPQDVAQSMDELVELVKLPENRSVIDLDEEPEATDPSLDNTTIYDNSAYSPEPMDLDEQDQLAGAQETPESSRLHDDTDLVDKPEGLYPTPDSSVMWLRNERSEIGRAHV